MITFFAVMTIATLLKVTDNFKETSNDIGCIIIVLCVISDIPILACSWTKEGGKNDSKGIN